MLLYMFFELGNGSRSTSRIEWLFRVSCRVVHELVGLVFIIMILMLVLFTR